MGMSSKFQIASSSFCVLRKSKMFQELFKLQKFSVLIITITIHLVLAPEARPTSAPKPPLPLCYMYRKAHRGYFIHRPEKCC